MDTISKHGFVDVSYSDGGIQTLNFEHHFFDATLCKHHQVDA